MEEKNKHLCKCKKCDAVFDYNDLIMTDRNLFDITIQEKRCPCCKGEWVPLEPPQYLNKFLHTNLDKKYFNY